MLYLDFHYGRGWIRRREITLRSALLTEQWHTRFPSESVKNEAGRVLARPGRGLEGPLTESADFNFAGEIVGRFIARIRLRNFVRAF